MDRVRDVWMRMMKCSGKARGEQHSIHTSRALCRSQGTCQIGGLPPCPPIEGRPRHHRGELSNANVTCHISTLFNNYTYEYKLWLAALPSHYKLWLAALPSHYDRMCRLGQAYAVMSGLGRESFQMGTEGMEMRKESEVSYYMKG